MRDYDLRLACCRVHEHQNMSTTNMIEGQKAKETLRASALNFWVLRSMISLKVWAQGIGTPSFLQMDMEVVQGAYGVLCLLF